MYAGSHGRKANVGVVPGGEVGAHPTASVARPRVRAALLEAHSFEGPSEPMRNSFRPGQRWVSVSEPELGLGEVRAVGTRTVTIAFRATGETRHYVRDDAPLRRAAFRVGDAIATASRRDLVVDAVQDDNGLLPYRCKQLVVPETELSPTLGFSNPLTRLYAGAFDPPAHFDLRTRALEHQHRIRQSPVRGFLGGRIDLLPHQIGIAADVAGRMLPRVLLADEVGLGKTIEAGLILHRLILTGRVSRVLILVPPSLVHQWFVELLLRFNLWFSIFDEGRCEAIQAARVDANPFLDSQLVLSSLDWLARTPDRLTQALDAGWDAVVVDEAHHLRWAPGASSAEHTAVEALGNRVPSLLLLTATPEQLGLTGHFARLRLLDPDRFHSLEDFRREPTDYRDVARIAGRMKACSALSDSDRAKLATWLGETRDQVNTASMRIAAGDAAAATSWVDALLDRHGTSRVMFRNTRATVAGVPERVPHLHALAPAAMSPDVSPALRREWTADAEGRKDVRQPQLRNDPRVDWLMNLLRRLDVSEKVLLLCRTPERALAIDAALKTRSATLRMAAFHEHLTLVQRDRAAAWFADAGGARMLICSEIGSEGRNFQFAHHLVLFDLPLDPALLEQRLGRLDRIGQRAQIHVHVPFIAGSHLEVLARWYHEGVDAFARHLPGGRDLLEIFEGRLRELADHIHDGRYASAPSLAQLLQDARDARHTIATRLEEGRDRLLEWNSYRPGAATRLIEAIHQEERSRALDDFLLAVLDLFVTEVEELAPRTYRLGSAGVLVDDFPGLPSAGLTLTADRGRALVRKELQFLTWDHPLVTGALDLLLGSERGNCSFVRVSGPDHAALLLDAIFVLECVVPPDLHLDRFLPPTPIRVVVDHNGRLAPDSDPPIDEAPLTTAGTAGGHQLLNRQDVRDVVLPRMIVASTRYAEEQLAPRVEESRARVREQLESEIQRLVHLQRINRSVRDAEIAGLRTQQAALDHHLSEARLRLDAVRLILKGG